MNIAICDDCKAYIKSVENFIVELDMRDLEYNVFEDGKELVKMYENNEANYDAILLDVEMKNLNGIETAKLIRKIDQHVIIVFITTHPKYMLNCFECEPFRYLLKPINFDTFRNLVYEINKKLKLQRKTVVFSEKRNRIRLFCDNIIYFECDSHWIWIYTQEKAYRICKTMSKLCENIDSEIFFRVHKSFVINMNYVKEIRQNDLLLYDSDKIIPISRTYKKRMLTAFLNFKERKYFV